MANPESNEFVGPAFTIEQLQLISALAPEQVAAIDNALIAGAHASWRKVALVVGSTMLENPNCIAGIPDLYYMHRVNALAAGGRLEKRGSETNLRYSEVRVPNVQGVNET